MPVRTVEIDSSTYERLVWHARPFVDSPNSVIKRALDALDKAEGNALPQDSPAAAKKSGQSPVASPRAAKPVDPDRPGKLAFTTIRSVTIEGESVAEPSWTKLVESLLVRGLAHVHGSLVDLNALVGMELTEGDTPNKKTRKIPGSDINYRTGLGANNSLRTIARVARGLGVPVDIRIEWEDTPGAARPREVGLIKIRP